MKLEYKYKENEFHNVKEVLKAKFQISDRLLTKLKHNKRIYLNGKTCYVTASLSPDDKIEVDLDFEEESDNIVPTKINLDIVYEDEALIIVNKPAGIPVHPSQTHYEDSLSNGVKYYFNVIGLSRKIRPVNRLDKDTSGLVIFAKNEYIQEALIRQMKMAKFKKEYIAFLDGIVEENSGTINAGISRKNSSIIEREINENGEIAISHFEVLKRFENYTKVKYTLETGRTHQLRVHSKFIGHPILGDSLYGKACPLIKRQALHAYKITFIHPISKEKIILETKLPKDMEQLD